VLSHKIFTLKDLFLFLVETLILETQIYWSVDYFIGNNCFK